MNKGTLYGVGVGPGDPELLTLKAARLIRECDVAVIPQKKERCFALRIALGAVPKLAEKPLIEIELPMTHDPVQRERAWAEGTARLAKELDAGRTVVFLTLGDPTVYSTCGYLNSRLLELGYDARMVPGVTSFCASAAALGVPLCEDREELHLLPGSGDAAGALDYPGTKVFMKGNLPVLLDALEERELSALGVQNCGTEKETLYHLREEIPADAGYYTVVIVKEKKQ